MIINKETKEILGDSRFPRYNWKGAPYILIPSELEAKATALAPYCDLVTKPVDENVNMGFDADGKVGEVLVDIVDNGERPEPPEPQEPEGQLTSGEVDFVRGMIDGAGGIPE